MSRFFTGLILGFLLGAVAVGYNPGLAERMHAVLAGVTATILRGTEETAEAVGEAAKEAADEAEQAADEPDVDAEPTAPEAAEETRQAAEEAAEETAEAGREAAEEVEREAEGLDERPATDRQ